MARNPKRYKTVVGNGPWRCYLTQCNDWIYSLGQDTGHVHHIDGNESNDDPANLAVMHQACHNALHNVGKISPIHGKTHNWGPQISEGLKGHRGAHRGWTSEARESLAATQRERLERTQLQRSPEYRKKMSDALKGHKGRGFTEEQRQQHSKILKESAKKWPMRTCECGLATKSPGGLATHIKASGHKEVI